MVLAFGSKCAACGSVESLEFDCINPKGNDHHRKSAPERICFYRRQAREGNLQLLCSACNALKGCLHPDKWRFAVANLVVHETIRRDLWFPGKDTPITPANRIEWLRDFCSRHFSEPDRRILYGDDEPF